MKAESWVFLGVAAVAGYFLLRSKMNAEAVTERVEVRQEEKSIRTETRQENKTERAEDRQASRNDAREDVKAIVNTIFGKKDKAKIVSTPTPVSTASYTAAKTLVQAKNPVPLISNVVQTAKVAEGVKNLKSENKYSLVNMVKNRPVVKVAAAIVKSVRG